MNRKTTAKKSTGKSRKSKTDRKYEVVRELPEPKAVVAVTKEQYHEIVKYLWYGSGGIIRPNRRVCTLVQLQASTGLRIGDAIRITLSDIIRDGNRWRFSLRESKTKKIRTYTVPDKVYNMLYKYAKAHNKARDEPLFGCTIRAVQKQVEKVADFLGIERVGTHSFRKYFATSAYEASGYDIEVVRKLLCHSSSSITRAYIGLSINKIERTLRKVVSVDYTYNINDTDEDIEAPAQLSTHPEAPDIGLEQLPQGGLSGLEQALMRDIKDAELAEDRERLLPLKCTLGILRHYIKGSPSGRAFPTVKTEDARNILETAGYPIP